MTWLGRVLHSEQLEKQLDAELRFDFDQRVAENIRSGLSEAEARRAARLEFGGIEQVKEECRDARGLQFFHSVLQDARYALRGMRRSPGFTAVAIVTLALGIGVNATVFTVTDAVLFKGFPFVARNDRILYIDSWKGNDETGVSWPDFEDWRAQAKSFEGMAVVHGVGIILSDKNGFPERYDATQISANTFSLIGQKPMIGRDFAPSDEIPGAAPVAILSYGFWERRFGKDPAIVGQTLRVTGISGNGISTPGAPTTVVGVMAPGFSFPQNQDLWLALAPTPDLQKREARDLWFVFGRMVDGITIASARAELETIGKRQAIAYPVTNRGFLPIPQTFQQFIIGPNAALIYGSMWGAVSFVLLIACANLANLMLARAIGRSREISVRIALGAGRRRIVRQLLIESTILSAMGGIFGWWIAKWGVRTWALAAFPDWERPWFDFTMDYRVLGYLIAISIGTGLLFGLAPALRLSKLGVNAALKDGGRGATGGIRGKHLSGLLVMGEMALAVVLLAGAGVMTRSFLTIYAADLGVKTTNVLMAEVLLPAARYPRAETQISFHERLKTGLEAIPGVESASIASSLPTSPSLKFPYELAGSEPVDPERRPTISALVVGEGYFHTLAAAIVAGREFQNTDGVSGVPVVVVNQRFASEYWPGENPLGKRLRVFDGTTPGAWRNVVGVVPDIVQNDDTGQKTEPLVYLPYRQMPRAGMKIIARTRVPPGDLGNAFRREVQAIDPDLPIWGPLTLAEVLKMWNYQDKGSFAVLFLIAAAIALLLASIGLYAVMAHSVSRRTQEMGIRMAIGATAGDIRKLVFRQGMLPVGIGLTIGLAASFAVNRVLESALVRVSPTDPITLVGAAATLILAAVLGCLIPARRAMRVDPAVSLRHE
jgi:putative ABC transport system permease protein